METAEKLIELAKSLLSSEDHKVVDMGAGSYKLYCEENMNISPKGLFYVTKTDITKTAYEIKFTYNSISASVASNDESISLYLDALYIYSKLAAFIKNKDNDLLDVELAKFGK